MDIETLEAEGEEEELDLEGLEDLDFAARRVEKYGSR